MPPWTARKAERPVFGASPPVHRDPNPVSRTEAPMPTPSRRPVDRQPAPFRRPDPVRTYTVLLKTMPNLWSSLQRQAVVRAADDVAAVHDLLNASPLGMAFLERTTCLPRRRLDRALFVGKALGLWTVR